LYVSDVGNKLHCCNANSCLGLFLKSPELSALDKASLPALYGLFSAQKSIKLLQQPGQSEETFAVRFSDSESKNQNPIEFNTDRASVNFAAFNTLTKASKFHWLLATHELLLLCSGEAAVGGGGNINSSLSNEEKNILRPNSTYPLSTFLESDELGFDDFPCFEIRAVDARLLFLHLAGGLGLV